MVEKLENENSFIKDDKNLFGKDGTEYSFVDFNYGQAIKKLEEIK